MRRLVLALSILALLAAFGLPITQHAAAAPLEHRSGCHRWHSCPSDSGSYVCGDLGYYSECPGGAPAPKPTARPKVKSSSGSSGSKSVPAKPTSPPAKKTAPATKPATKPATRKAVPPTATSAPPPPPAPTDTPAPPPPTDIPVPTDTPRPAVMVNGSNGRASASDLTSAATSQRKEYTASETVGGIATLILIVGTPIWLYRRWRHGKATS